MGGEQKAEEGGLSRAAAVRSMYKEKKNIRDATYLYWVGGKVVLL